MTYKKETRAQDYLKDVSKWGNSPSEGFALHVANSSQSDHIGAQHAPSDGGSSISYAAYRDGSHLCLRDGVLYAAESFADIEAAHARFASAELKNRLDEANLPFMRLLITECLTAGGWTPFEGPALATKTFETAVGDKEAVAWLQDWGKDSDSYMLSGEYQSEGHNALASSSILIPKSARGDEVRDLVAKFTSNADEAVAQTYAARLHRPRE